MPESEEVLKVNGRPEIADFKELLSIGMCQPTEQQLAQVFKPWPEKDVHNHEMPPLADGG